MRFPVGVRGVTVPLVNRFWDKVDKENGPVHPEHGRCWQWIAAIRGKGYGAIRSDDGRTLRAHRVAFRLTNGWEPPPSMDLMHKCDNRACVNPGHLVPGTRLDNMRDAVSKGRIPRGSARRNCKVTDAQVYQIRTYVKDGFSRRAVAGWYGISLRMVDMIGSGKRRPLSPEQEASYA